MKVVLPDPVRNGSHTIEVPTPWADLNDAVQLYQDIREKSNKAFQAVEETRLAIDVAYREHQDKLAAAVLDGGKQPQRDAVAAAEAKHAAAAELSAATRQAHTMAFDRIEQLIEQHRGDWTGSAAVAEADATAVYAEAVEALVAAREGMQVARAHSAFVRHFPANKAGWIMDRDMIAVNNTKMPWPNVEIALRREAGTAKPEPRTLPEQVAALQESADTKRVAA